jgi:hypothetical protein
LAPDHRTLALRVGAPVGMSRAAALRGEAPSMRTLAPLLTSAWGGAMLGRLYTSGGTMSDADLQREIAEELKPTADELAADSDAAKTRMQKVVDALSEALRAQNAPLIKQHLAALDGLMGDYAALVSRGKALIARVGKLSPEDERSAAAKALADLNKALGERQGRLDGNYEKLKQLQAMAHKSLEQADSAAARLRQAWADMEAYLTTNKKLYDTRLEQIATLEQAARAAVGERDAKDLAKIQSRNEDRKSWKPTIADIDSRLINFFGESGKELDPSMKEQFTRDRVKFNATFEGVQATDAKIEAHYKTIKALAIKPIDPKKAADAMEIPKGNEAKVKKALDAGSLSDGLDDLARELKLKASGSELMNRLKKAKLL